MPAKRQNDPALDGYVCSSDSAIAMEHQQLSEFLAAPGKSELAATSAKLPKDAQIRLLRAAIERIEFQKGHAKPQKPLIDLLQKVAGRKMPYGEADVISILQSAGNILQPRQDGKVDFEDLDIPIPGVIPAMLEWLEARSKEGPLSPALLEQLRRVHAGLKPMEFWAGFKKTVQRMEALLEGQPSGMPTGGEVWADAIWSDIERMDTRSRKAWLALLENAPKGTSANPTSAWRKKADDLLTTVGKDAFAAHTEHWFAAIGSGTTERIHARNASLLRALIWYSSLLTGEAVCRALANAVEGGLRKVPNGGLYASSISKAAICALEAMPGIEPVAQLLRLKHRVKSPWGLEEIQKAFNAAVERSGVSVSELEEVTTPTFDLDCNGTVRKTIGSFTAELRIIGTQEVTVSWTDEKGKSLLPSSKPLKAHADEVKGVKRLASDMEKMLGAHRDRIEQLYRCERTWDYATWLSRYLNHPLLAQQTRRLIWQFTEGNKATSGIWCEGKMLDTRNRNIDWLSPNTRVQLWHPLGVPVDTVQQWRAWLDVHQVTQPFKQAHREIYILTDAELSTRTYSNRFASHILRQHQFKALCDARGWKYAFLGTWDGGGNTGATLDLPQWQLRAQFWIDYAGGEASPAGVALHVSTDQVRFSDPNSSAKELFEIPAVAFSEVMRDVDLFVGVCSIGADPTWQDDGENRHREYWNAFSFGNLNATAATRRSVLAQLLPKLKIAKQCNLEDKFLVVRGSLRTYKIHLGSGNILMEPNDQYLCIVPDRTLRTDEKVFLPFEGDNLTAIIISKAFMLADDAKIKDPAILNQIHLK